MLHNKTEEDTFNALRRISYKQMREIVDRELGVYSFNSHDKLVEILREHNWKVSDYTKYVMKSANSRF